MVYIIDKLKSGSPEALTRKSHQKPAETVPRRVSDTATRNGLIFRGLTHPASARGQAIKRRTRAGAKPAARDPEKVTKTHERR